MRLIDADVLYELIDGGYDLDFSEVPETKKELLNIVNYQETIDAVPVVHGEWIKHCLGRENFPWGFDCSICKEWFVIDSKRIGLYKYCPNCGAKMDGNGKDDEHM